ncbi:hypothetical protein SPBR_08451 [Sporothrix brasiliensis 5110]|uniref:non-specific serine/threonine protein kinase n=1 Tax=Sporothrix brasiliensis 5110 TaxID=1398154 RepID=A0A0C2IHB5_9PEZI|nr:uncharacterized protein SPBR_08451 [Sporothrix brasiliensis 5110]KIH86420.1 hypothetical protein SPBR_08451 [Sporothrix brasiliensis 5110]
MASSPPDSPSPPPRESSNGCSPRVFPKTGFEVIDPEFLVEEEKLPTYNGADYYPMRLGNIVGGHYQVVAKLGYGTTSTVWLAKDLNKKRLYKALKVHTRDAVFEHERSVYDHLRRPVPTEVKEGQTHPGRGHVRAIDEVFMLKGPHGEHEVFVMAPLGMSLATMQMRQRTGALPTIFVTQALLQTLMGLSLLHEADIIHTDLHADNLLIAMTDDAILTVTEENEFTKPSPRKIVGDRVTQVSQYVLGGAGPLTISDLGQARIGKEHTGIAMPLQYRAPEVILGMPWGPAVDLWSMGVLAWSLLEPTGLFDVYAANDGEANNAHHLAAMTALLGPPPKAFRDKSMASSKYWGDDGSWQGAVPLPPTKPLADRVTTVDGEQKAGFLSFLELCLTWEPEMRLTPDQMYFHPWLHGKPIPKEEQEEEAHAA